MSSVDPTVAHPKTTSVAKVDVKASGHHVELVITTTDATVCLELGHDGAGEIATMLHACAYKAAWDIPMIDRDVDELELSVRAYNCLKVAGLERVSDLVVLTAKDLLKFKNCGTKTVREIETELARCGLTLGMEIAGKDVDLPRVQITTSREDDT